MLTAEEVYHFDLKGYVLVKKAFEPDVIRALHDQLYEIEGLGKDQLPPHCVPNWTPVINEYRIWNIIECADVFIQLIDHPQILSRVEAIVPGPIRLTEAYSISRRRGIGLPLHATDIAEYTVTRSGPRSKHVKAIINLTDCGPEDGPLVVFEGTHKLGVPFPYSVFHPDWSAPIHDVAYAQQFSKSAAAHALSVPWEQIPGYKEVCVEAGDLIVFTEDLWHGGKELRSERTRRSLYFAYSPYHYTSWHGIECSDKLKACVTERQRQLISGPFIGYRYQDADTSELPSSLPFPFMPNSETATTWSRSAPVASRTSSIGLDQIVGNNQEFFEWLLQKRMAGHPELAQQPLGICQFILTGDGGGKWFLELTAKGGRVVQGESDTPDCLVELSAQDFEKLAKGAIPPAELFYRGGLKVRGNISMAMQIASLCGK